MKKLSIIISIVIATAIFTALLPADIQQSGVSDQSSVLMAYANPLELLQSKGIIQGYQDGQLHPERLLTREEFAVIINRAYQDPIVHERIYKFSDLSERHWSYTEIQKACNAGWLQGFPDGTFRPDENITYEQAVTVMCRVIGIPVYGDYPDAYIAAGIEYAVSDGVDALIGENINRMQAAQLVVNALNYEEGQIERTSGGSYANAKFAPSASAGGGGGSVMMFDASYSVETEAVFEDNIADYEEPWNYNTEEYSSEDENVFKKVTTSPLSTFSIDTDTASYSNMRRFILNGQTIPNGAIRSEELINYFDYSSAEIGEETPFGVKYTVAECPWNTEHNLAMVTVSGEELTETKPSNIVFLIDVSGSMYSYNKLPLVKQALGMLLDNLGENDRISVVTYASGTQVVLEPTPATEKEKIIEVINGLNAGGSTSGSSGIQLAYEQAERYKCDGNNRVILCTDGDFNVGITSLNGLEEFIEEKRESGIFLSVLGFGMGNYKDNTMEVLADKGNGNYAYIDTLKEAKKVLVDEMSKTIYTIAKDVKIQVEFNPEVVSEYRLVGYENRLLNNEDFDNDKKDAGELGAGATVTVMYELIPSDGNISSDLKYQKTEGVGSDELMTVKIRYKAPEGNESMLTEYTVSSELTDKTDDDFRFAASVAALGMILNNSEYKGSATLDMVIGLAQGAMGEDPYGIRCEFVQLVDLLRYRYIY